MAHRLYPHAEARLAKLRGEDEVLRLSLIDLRINIKGFGGFENSP